MPMRCCSGSRAAICSTRRIRGSTNCILDIMGRVIKTIFLCEFLSDPRLRQEIQEALNVIEQWNSVNGFIFSARGGELLSNRPEDQEIAVLSLHLIQVSLALINTLLLQDVLAEEQWKAPMKAEDW